jgi:ribosome-binding factor A
MNEALAKIKDERMGHLIKDLAAQYVARHSNRQSLLTVTRVMLSSDLKHANIMLSILPRTAEAGAIDFLNRNRDDFREFMKSKSRLHILPYAKFFPDEGEYNRQRVSELLDEDTKKAE